MIGKMEPNRQQKPARREEVLIEEDARRRGKGVQVRRYVCLARLKKRLGNGLVRGADKGTLYALALAGPVMMAGGTTLLAMRVTVARRASVILRPLGMPCIACLGTIVRMMRAAPHDKVNHHNRGTQMVQ